MDSAPTGPPAFRIEGAPVAYTGPDAGPKVSNAHAILVTEATQEGRAAALWRLKRLLDTTESDIERDCRVLIAAENEAANALWAIREERQRLQAAHPLSGLVKQTQEHITLLKGQFLTNYKPGDPKTITTPDGDKVQVRSSSVPVIDDSQQVARVLMEKDLWLAAGVVLTAKPDMLVPLIENGVLSGKDDEDKPVAYAHLEAKNSLAMTARKGG